VKCRYGDSLQANQWKRSAPTVIQGTSGSTFAGMLAARRWHRHAHVRLLRQLIWMASGSRVFQVVYESRIHQTAQKGSNLGANRVPFETWLARILAA